MRVGVDATAGSDGEIRCGRGMAWHGSIGGGWPEELAFHQVGVRSVRFLYITHPVKPSVSTFPLHHILVKLTSHPLPLTHHRPPPTPLRLRPPRIHRSRHSLSVDPARDETAERIRSIRKKGVGGVEVVVRALGDESEWGCRYCQVFARRR